MYCIECGSKIEETQIKCLKCGAKQPLKIFKTLNVELVAHNNMESILAEINGALKVIAKGTNAERIEKIKTISNPLKLIIASGVIIILSIIYSSAPSSRIPYFRNNNPQCAYDVPNIIYNYAFNGTRVQSPLYPISIRLSIEQIQGHNVLEQEKQISEAKEIIKTGTANFQSRQLPACVEKINLNLINRSEGTRSKLCFNIAYLNDSEFKVVRNIRVFECDSAESEIKNWANENIVIGF
jgi:hypothetical protein